MGDDELVPVDPREESFIRRTKKKMDDSKLVEAIIRWGVVAVLGAGSAMATHQVEDSSHVAVVQDNRNEVLALQAEVKLLREGFAQRIDVEEKEREADMKKQEHRLTRVETLLEVRLGVAPMPAAEAAAPPNP